MEEIPIAFDWWRLGGRIIKAPATPQPPITRIREQQMLMQQHQQQQMLQRQQQMLIQQQQQQRMQSVATPAALSYQRQPQSQCMTSSGPSAVAPVMPPLPPLQRLQPPQLPSQHQQNVEYVMVGSAAVPVTYQQSAQYGDNAWPIHQSLDDSDKDSTSNPQDPYAMDCEVSRDYWHEPYKRKKCPRRCAEGPRPAWRPAKIPTDCTGVVNYPPPYSRYCRNMDKPVCYVCKH